MRSQSLHVLTLALLLSASVLVFTKTYRSPKLRPDDYVAIINKTSDFQVLQATRAGGQLTLSLKNNYAQTITAFAFTFGRSFRITEDFITSEVSDVVGIQPHQTFEKTYPLQSNEDITLQAVVMADKTGDGDATIFKEISDTRLGQAVQIKRSLRVLEKYANAGLDLENLEAEMRAALDRPELETLKAVKEIRPVGTINRKSSDTLSHEVKEGLAYGRSNVLRKLGEAKTSPFGENYFLLKTKAFYENLLNRL